MLLSANIILCESVLLERNDVASAVRIVNVITLAPGNNVAHFKAHTMLNSDSADLSTHVLQLQVFTRSGQLVVSAPQYRFVFANRLDFSGPGAFNLTTDFNVDINQLPALGYFTVVVFLDGERVATTPIMLRRG